MTAQKGADDAPPATAAAAAALPGSDGHTGRSCAARPPTPWPPLHIMYACHALSDAQ